MKLQSYNFIKKKRSRGGSLSAAIQAELFKFITSHSTYSYPFLWHQDDRREIIALAESGPSLPTLGITFVGDTSLTNSASSVKLQCSLYGTSYLESKVKVSN